MVLSLHFCDKFSVLNIKRKRRSNDEFSHDKQNLKKRYIGYILHKKNIQRQKKPIAEDRNQYVYQLCTRYHIDYSIFVQVFQQTTFFATSNEWKITPRRDSPRKQKTEKKIQPKEKERTNKTNDKTFAQQVLCAHFSIGLNYSISNRLQTFFPLFSS